MIRTRLVCLVVVSLLGAPLGAAPVTVEQCLTGARQAALEARSRELLLKIGDYERTLDPAAAKSDYELAALAPRTSSGIEAYSARDLALRFLQLGEVEKARQVILPALDALADKQPPVPTLPLRDYWYRDQVTQTSLLAPLLYPADMDRLQQALAAGEACLRQITDPGQQRQALANYLPVLALVKPEEALQRWQADLSTWGVSAPVVSNGLKQDYKLVLARLEGLFLPGRSMATSPYWPGVDEYSVRVELLAAVLRAEPAALSGAVKQLRLDQPFGFENRTSWLPFARVVRERGLAALPRGKEFRFLYLNCVEDLARLDYPLAREFAAALPEPSDRAMALGSIVKVSAPSDLQRARETARALVEAEHALAKPYAYPLAIAVYALAEKDEQVVPDLLREIPPSESLGLAFAPWWKAHRPAAEAFLATLPPAGQLSCLPALLKQAGDLLTPAEKSKWAEKALTLEGYGSDVGVTRDLILQTAAFDPDLARKLWQALPPLDPAKPQEQEAVSYRLDELVATAQALQARRPGTSGPEEAEIERMLAAAGEKDYWSYQYRGRLADLYAYYDQPKARTALDQLLADLATPPRQVPVSTVAADLVRTLARIDPEAAGKLLLERQDLKGDWQVRRDVVATIATRDPEAGFALAQQVYPNSGPQDMLETIGRLTADAPVAATRRFVDLYIDDAKDKPNAVMFVANTLFRAGNAELIADLPRRLDTLDQPGAVSYVLNSVRTQLGLASDEVLQELLKRVQAIERPATRDGEYAVLAALAERDWDTNHGLLEALDPKPRAEAFLAMLAIKDHRAMVDRGE